MWSIPFLPRAFSAYHLKDLFNEYTHISSAAEEGSPFFDSEENRQKMHYRSEAETQMLVALTRFIILFGLEGV